MIIDIVGNTYNSLTVIEYAGKKKNDALWKCQCVCGGIKYVITTSLKRNKVKSCGCSNSDNRFIHGMSKSSEWSTWKSMKSRCQKENDKCYKDYGARGITVCERWNNSFIDFVSDMGKKPSSLHTLDRINNNGNYEPKNCKWSTMTEQCRNRRNNIFITHNDRTLILAEWARELNINHNTLIYHLKRKSIAEIISYYEKKNSHFLK